MPTDRQTDITGLIVAFCNFSNATKKKVLGVKYTSWVEHDRGSGAPRVATPRNTQTWSCLAICLVHFPKLHHSLNNSVTNTGATCFFSWPNWARNQNPPDSLAEIVQATSSWTVSDIGHFYKTIFLKMFVPSSPNDRLKHGISVC